MAKDSRSREMDANRQQGVQQDGSFTETTAATTGIGFVRPDGIILPKPVRKRLRWPALLDSGMGPLGFKTEIPKPGDSNARNTVDIIYELVDAKMHSNAPIEFLGMCTHMAEANETSTYTHSQIERFTGLLERVRAAGIFTPTVSTDNSAALLTTSLTTF